MSSLWTPAGEHRLPEQDPPSTGATAQSGTEQPGAPPGDDEELSNEFARIEQELLTTPVGDVVANHCYGFFQLGALHLSQNPPNLVEARVAIDALSAVVDALGDRLGESYKTLLDGLAQIRLAYVQIAGSITPAETNEGEDPEPA